ncbi:aspartate/tyrosine/aromatic aminotransferase [Pseudomonas sp. B21-056]|jgi:aromatic-amino-acid transaminase|uniref:amino acid aminotransferase n=1 Tax=Pseudomonas sp. B21-056 TaxID=2895495 RepID=UPI0022324DE4|nr:amino acid aminotransferase [Pseudomonas sp. B21-056]UZE22467.1 aspartate/tyrosine/aromatic aminotransferase [Pseudomonas sp. B21-056]
MFEHVEIYPGDPILSLMEDYQKDPRTEKVNLSIGFYYDEHGNVPVLESVKKAKSILDTRTQEPNLYLPMDGLPSFRKQVQQYLFGEADAEHGERIVTLQTVGGSGAIRVGADFLKRYYPDAEVWISDPTWDNHHAIFKGAGFEVQRYPYLKEDGRQINFEGLIATFESLPANTIVLLHACCHNPTGLDLAPGQWDALFSLFARRSLIPFLDAAYLGLGEGLAKDSYAIRALAGSGITGLVSNSFSKVFSLYGERVGSLSVICQSSVIAGRVAGQLKGTVRTNYSNPPRFGAELVSIILGEPSLRTAWLAELERMRQRMVDMRHALYDEIKTLKPYSKVEYLVTQSGMFSYSGLTADAVDRIREKHGIYFIRNGRICIAGLNALNVSRVAIAIASES